MSDNLQSTYLNSREVLSVDRRCRPRPNMAINLFGKLSEESLSEASSEDTHPSSSNVASVYLRLRPAIKQSNLYSIEHNIFKTIISEGNASATHCRERTEKHYTFSKIFDGSTSQADIYNSGVYTAIENEDSLSVLTYGVSGSGKTYTLLGNANDPGIIPRAIEHIFTRYQKSIEEKPFAKIENGNIILMEDLCVLNEEKNRLKILQECSGSSDSYYQQQQTIHDHHQFKTEDEQKIVFIWISFAEIYNENVYDLLSTELNDNKENVMLKKRRNLKIISNEGNTFIKGLKTIHITNSQDAHQLLRLGQSHISYASTNINANSSRSHCIFFIDVICCAAPNQFYHIAYRFCDLAGSERLKKTENIGNRLKEAQRINNSLLVLGRCLDVVYNNQSKKRNDIVPIRDSKLTLLLQAPLLGREPISMIVNMLPTKEYLEENQNVLNFSSIANQIVYKANPQRKPSRSTRFSFFGAQIALINRSSPGCNSNINSSGDSSILMEENYRLKQRIDDLNHHIDTITKQFEKDEIEGKRKMVNEWQALIASNMENAKKQLARREDRLKNEFEVKIKQIEMKYEKQIAQLEEKLEQSYKKPNLNKTT